MSKATRLAMFIPGDTPPLLGFDVEWHDTYLAAINSSTIWTGYFKANISGGLSNIMVFSEMTVSAPNPDFPAVPEAPEFIQVPNPLPVNELDIANSASFSACWLGEAIEARVSGNPLLDNISGSEPLTVLQANGTAITTLPTMADGAIVRFDNNNLLQAEVDALYASLLTYDEEGVVIGARPNITIENNGNADVDLVNAGFIEGAGGKVWETNSGLLTLQTTASVATGFIFFINAGADVDWYEDDVEAVTNTNNHTFFFTDNSIKTIAIRGTDVSQGKYIIVASKSLTGTFDMSAMTSAAFRIDFSTNPDLTEVILPKTDGVMDQLMGFGTGISTLRLDKLPGLVNSASIQIRLGDCPNLDANSVCNHVLAIDTYAQSPITGRQLWFNGTTVNPDPGLVSELEAQGWTMVL